MKWKALGIAVLVVGTSAGVLLAPFLSRDVLSQPSPSKVIRGASDPDRADWQPNARVNPKKPVQVIFVNNFGEPFRYTLMGHTDARELKKGMTAKLGKVPLPAYVAVNPVRDKINIRYKVSVKDNIVTLEVKPAKGQGQRALEIDAKGEIYAY
jgi:hypothetical protein